MNRLPALLLISVCLLLACKSQERMTKTAAPQQEASGGTADPQTNEAPAAQPVSDTSGTARQAQQDRSNKQMLSALYGEWQWIRTACCGRVQQDSYPAASDPPRIISFFEEGSARYFSGREKTSTSLLPFRVGSLGPIQPTITIGEMRPAIFRVHNDTLTLDWGYIDLHTEYYTRVR